MEGAGATMAAANRRLRSLTTQLGSVAPAPTVTLAEEVDLVIRGVTIVDGTGQPGRPLGIEPLAMRNEQILFYLRNSIPGMLDKFHL